MCPLRGAAYHQFSGRPGSNLSVRQQRAHENQAVRREQCVQALCQFRHVRYVLENLEAGDERVTAPWLAPARAGERVKEVESQPAAAATR